MNEEIAKKKPDYIRVHDSGDYYSRAYLDKWLAIAIHNPQVRFYMSTPNEEQSTEDQEETETTEEVSAQDTESESVETE